MCIVFNALLFFQTWLDHRFSNFSKLFWDTYFRIIIYYILLSKVNLLFVVCSVDRGFILVDTRSLFVGRKVLIESSYQYPGILHVCSGFIPLHILGTPTSHPLLALISDLHIPCVMKGMTMLSDRQDYCSALNLPLIAIIIINFSFVVFDSSCVL